MPRTPRNPNLVFTHRNRLYTDVKKALADASFASMDEGKTTSVHVFRGQDKNNIVTATPMSVLQVKVTHHPW